VSGKVDVLLPEFGEELGGRTRKLDAHTLHAISELRRHRLNYGDGTILIQINFLNSSYIKVFLWNS
jgi:hypothetical protein